MTFHFTINKPDGSKITVYGFDGRQDGCVIIAQDGANPKAATLQTDPSALIQALHDTMQAQANLMPH